MSKAVAKAESKPSYLVDLEKKGPVQSNDNFDKSDVVVPRIKLLQGNSPEIETFNEAKSGTFWHTGFDMNLGDEIRIVICSRNKKSLLMAPMEDGQGVLARADDNVTWDQTGKWEVKIGKKETAIWEIDTLKVAESKAAQWGSSDPEDKDSPPAATLFYDYLVILPDYPDLGPAVMSLARTQIKKAKKGLNDKIELHQSAGRPMQALVFKAAAINDKNSAGQSFYNWSFYQSGFADEELYHKAIELSEVMRTYRVQDETGAASEADAPKAESEQF